MQNPGLFPAACEWAAEIAQARSSAAPVPAPAAAPRNPEPLERIDSRRAFVAVSPAMRELRRQVEQVAGIDAVVLLLGESGTGKEVVARLIHKLSSRSARKFLKVNCAALPLELLESELFGHEAGAFTGARQARAGKFEICHKGTIFLDEIAEMPVSPQAKLLHVLQDGEFSRLGSASTMQSDVRVLAATNVDVRQAVQAGTLRADLYYRLNVFTIHLPPLRDRREDLPYLLDYFMTTWAASYARPRLPITRRILETCASYSWPGNVRELENFVKRYLVLGDEKLALNQLDHRTDAAPPALAAPREAAAARAELAGNEECCDLKSLVRGLKKDAERVAILEALDRTGGNKQEAAALLRISLRALHYKVRAYAIDSSSRRGHGAAPRDGNAAPRPQQSGNALYEFPRNGKLIPMDRAASERGTPERTETERIASRFVR